jgi:hypothetical protein
MADHENLTAALADVQAHLPAISKDKTAKVKGKSKAGNEFDYTYKYVDLATISEAVLPLLAGAGLAWTTLPTLEDGGRFVLRYALRHVSGDSLDGAYPLPSAGSPQEIGSAITYARRYTLCSVVGIAPDEDDDGAAATKAHGRPAPPDEPPDPRKELRAQIAAFARDHDLPLDSVADTFQANYKAPITAGSVDMLTAFLDDLKQDAVATP